MSEVQSANNYKFVNSHMSFEWLCHKCTELNRTSWESWRIYKGLVECSKCEQAFNLRAPWESVFNEAWKPTTAPKHEGGGE